MVVASNRYEKRTPKHAKGWLESGVTRRTFMKMTGAFAAGTAVGHTFFRENQAKAMNFGDPTLVETDENVAIKYSVCLACHSACGIRCKVVDGVLVKIDGNPYHPNCLESHVPYDTAPEVAKLTVGKNCAKSQAGIQVVYNPFRIKEPLKRVGARGSGQWETIPWSQAFSEIGAQLNALRDLDTPLASSDTHFGPLANKVIFSGGRNQHGQMEFTDRFWGNCFGTVNKRHDHSSVSHTSHHVGYALATGNGAFGREAATTGSTDLPNCEFVLWFGSDPMSANFPFVPQARKLGEMISRGGRVAVVDPRCSVRARMRRWRWRSAASSSTTISTTPGFCKDPMTPPRTPPVS